MATEKESGDQPTYRSRTEAATALAALTPEEHAKLMGVARTYWSRRGLNDRWGSPEDLLGEAVERTLKKGGKRWRTGVDITHHLKRAMENISGHWARKRNRFAMHEVEPSDDKPHQPRLPVDATAPRVLESKESLDLLRKHFGRDEEGFGFVVGRAQGKTESEAAAELGIELCRIEAVARRCRRKVATFIHGRNG